MRAKSVIVAVVLVVILLLSTVSIGLAGPSPSSKGCGCHRAGLPGLFKNVDRPASVSCVQCHEIHGM